MNNSSTLRQALSDSLWSRDLDRQNRYIAAEEKARAETDQVADVLDACAFACDDDNCLMTPDGAWVQCAMRVTHRETGRAVSVVCKVDDTGAAFWFVLDMTRAYHEAGVLIAAVQQRIASNRRAN